MRMYEGNPPSGPGWSELAAFRGMYGANEWIMFSNTTDESGRYLNLKLFPDCKVESKANYWMSWDRVDKKLRSRGMDVKLLKSNRPDLHKFVVNFLECV